MLYLFGEWELDVELYELRRGHQLIQLEPQVFNVLAYLVQHHNRIISKQELFTHLWPDQYIGDSALERCIMSARKAVGDSGCKQQIIKTFNRRGYRMIAPVTEVPPNSGNRVQPPAVVTPELNDSQPAQESGKQPAQEPWTQPSVSQSPVANLEPQRRCVTILSCDSGTARALLRTDEIEAGQPVSPSLHDQTGLLIEDYGGLMVHFQDHGCLALFGLTSPVDHAWRAVQAALALQHRGFDIPQGLEAIPREGLPLGCGLHTGEVIEKRLSGASQVIYMAVNDAMQVAANLSACAEPGRILVSDVTYQLIKEVADCRVLARLAAVIADPISLVAYDVSPCESPVSVVESSMLAISGSVNQ
ncbi:MAG: winged helix-turn-helix domain-containing protein [Candidatus Tectomicrobia bacterium]|nr:winged helix-turn-helix domain-containing protein [Candidatus Tectomicrobia bacterium]